MEVDAGQIDHQLFNVADYPVLSGLAEKLTSATRLDGRASRYMYSMALETIDPAMLTVHELALMKMLGIDLT